jgi:hypothetical protein
MAKVRSPNFPVIDLNAAIDAVGKIYVREKRGSFPQMSAATHLGYTSINGRSLGMFAALRAYGLINGRGDSLEVTADAIALIEAPADSPDRVAALTRAFSGPPMFNLIQEQYPEPPSEQTLRWWLIQQGFTADGADKAAQIFLESRKLVTLLPEEYIDPTRNNNGGESRANAFKPSIEAEMNRFMPPPGGGEPKGPTLPLGGTGQESIAMGIQERVLQSGMLSKSASYRVIVSGHMGKAEFDKLIAKLEMDRDILTDSDPLPAMPVGYSDHDSDNPDA